MHKIRKRTEMYRATVSQEARLIVPTEEHAEPNAVRRVHIIVPPSPELLMGIDVSIDDLRPNDAYKLSPAPPGNVLVFQLFAGQTIIALASEEKVHASVIVEYIA